MAHPPGPTRQAPICIRGAEEIGGSPPLHDLAVFQAGDVKRLELDRKAGGCDTREGMSGWTNPFDGSYDG